MKKISIVTPVFNEQEALPGYVAEVTRTLLDRRDYKFEVIFVDDGSEDRSWEIIADLCQKDPRFKAIRLSRNMGAHVADTAGLTVADGDAVAILACDLQDPPEVILQFVEKWEKGAKLVWGHRKSRQDSSWKILASGLLLRMIRKYAMPRGSKVSTGGFLLADKQVVQAFRKFPEHNRIVFALMGWTGFKQDRVEYDRAARAKGKSGWRLGSAIKAAYDVMIGYSAAPFRMITAVGLIASFLSAMLAVFLIYSKLTSSPLKGWTGTVFTITVYSSIQFLLTGIIGEYLFRIHSEVVRRPLFLISDSIGALEQSESEKA